MIYREHYNCKFPNLFGARAITFGKHIFYTEPKTEVSDRLRVHELVHVKQYEEHGVLKFLYKYAKEYLKGRASGLGHWDSYYDISFEKEAFKAEREGVNEWQ